MLRRDALEREVIEVALEEEIELLATILLFEASQEERAFFVGDLCCAVVRISSCEIDMQDGVFRRKRLDLIFEILQAECGFHLFSFRTVDRFLTMRRSM